MSARAPGSVLVSDQGHYPAPGRPATPPSRGGRLRGRHHPRQLLLRQHRVELRQVRGQQVVERLAGARRLVVQDPAHLELGGGGREVGVGGAAQQVDELLGHLHRPAQGVLAAAGDPYLEEVLLDGEELLVERLGRVLDLLRPLVAEADLERGELAAGALRLVDGFDALLHVVEEVPHEVALRAHVGLAAAGAGVLEDGERLGQLVAAGLELDLVLADGRLHLDARDAGRRDPLHADLDVLGAERAGAQPRLRRLVVLEIPPGAVQAGLGRTLERPYHLARGVLDLDLDLVLLLAGRLVLLALDGGGQPVLDGHAVRRVEAGHRVVEVREGRLDAAPAVGRPRREQLGLRRRLAVEAPQRRHVVEDPEAAAVGGQHQVAEALLHGDAVDRGVGQAARQRLPAPAVVERDVEAVLGAQVEEAAPRRVLAQGMDVGERAARDAVDDRRPGAAVVPGLEDERIAVVDLVQVDGDVGGAGLVARRLDGAHRPPGRQAVEVRGHVGPGLAAVLGELQLAVVGPGPDEARLQPRLGDREDDAGVLDADVVGGEAAGDLLARLVVQGEVGADHLPGGAGVGGLVDVLAADVDAVVVVRGDGQRERPEEAVLQVGGRPAGRPPGPDLDAARGVGAHVVAGDDAAAAAGAGGAGPDDVRVLRIGRRPAALAAADAGPHAAGDERLIVPRAQQVIARAAGGRPVLAVAVHLVRDAVVHRHVVDLRDRQLYVHPAAPAVDADRHAAVVADDQPVAVQRVDPDVVMVAARHLGVRRVDDRLAAVAGLGP